MQRESFGSRLGFLLVSAGCAIGIGNVWRFPYITGKNGGGYFVLFYLVCLLLLGVPVMTMELAVGRGGRKSAVLAYKNLEKPGSKWHIHGWFSLVYLLFCVSKWGWGFDKYVAEANKGKGLKFAKWLKPYFQFVLPVLIAVIFLQGLL